MAPRKTTKDGNMEHVEKAAETGDASQPKKRKITKSTAKTSDKVQEPRVLRSSKAAGTQNKDLDAAIPPVKKPQKKKNVTNPDKISAPKEQSKKALKSKKTEIVEEEADEKNVANVIDKEKSEKVPVKNSRRKATKKAGMDVAETYTKEGIAFKNNT